MSAHGSDALPGQVSARWGGPGCAWCKCYDFGNINDVELRYADKGIERICTDARQMQKKLGADVAKKLKLRITELIRVEEMNDLLAGTGKWEQLKADRAGQWSARLTANWRLIVQPEEGERVTVLVVEIVDYH